MNHCSFKMSPRGLGDCLAIFEPGGRGSAPLPVQLIGEEGPGGTERGRVATAAVNADHHEPRAAGRHKVGRLQPNIALFVGRTFGGEKNLCHDSVGFSVTESEYFGWSRFDGPASVRLLRSFPSFQH